MKAITEVASDGNGRAPGSGVWRRLAWFVGLWLAGVASVGLVSLILRGWIGP